MKSACVGVLSIIVLDCVYEWSVYTKHNRLPNTAIKMVSLYQST